MSLRKNIAMKKEDRKRLILGDRMMALVVTKTGVEDGIETATLSLEKAAYETARTFDGIIAKVSEGLKNVKEIENNFFDVTSEIFVESLHIAARNRRGQATHLLLNKRTLASLSEEIKENFREKGFNIEVSNGVPENMIIVGYIGAAYDSCIRSSGKILKKYYCIPSMLEKNYTAFVIL